MGLGVQPGHPVAGGVPGVVRDAVPLPQRVGPRVAPGAAALGLDVQLGQLPREDGQDLPVGVRGRRSAQTAQQRQGC